MDGWIDEFVFTSLRPAPLVLALVAGGVVAHDAGVYAENIQHVLASLTYYVQDCI